MIGTANVHEFGRTGVSQVTDWVDLTPPGDMPGFYWGAVRASLIFEGTYTPNAPPANGIYSQLITVEVGGVEVFRTRHVNRNWWAPVQYYQNAQFINQQWDNYVWSSAQVVGNVVNPTPTIIGDWDGANNGSPLRSYQNAFFEPAQVGPAAAPLPFTVGNVPRNPTASYRANGEWVYFTFTAGPGQTIRVRNRAYREVPNPALNPPISDTAPGSGQDAEPDEVLVTGTPTGQISGWVEGWILRTGGFAETVLPIASIDAGVGGGVGLDP
jgi:hypothetical protein